MAKIIDVHSHYMPPEVAEHTAFFKVGWSDINRQLKLMDDNGIEKSLLLYPTSDAHLNMGGWKDLARIYNQKISELINRHGDRFMGACIIPFGDRAERDNTLSNFSKDIYKAFSLASSYDGIYLDDEYFDPVFQLAQNKNIPIHVHSQIINPIGSQVVHDPLLSPVLEYVFDVSMCLGKLMMSGVLMKYPDVKIIFAHYGGVLPVVKERFDTTYAMLRKREIVKDLKKPPSAYFKNLYFDTSGSRSAASLLCALEVADTGHVLFGSDYPANQDFAGALDVMGQAGLSGTQVEEIISNNALSMLS